MEGLGTLGGPIVRVTKRGEVDIASEPINDQTLYTLLSSKFRWERIGPGGSFVPSNPDSNVVQNLLRGHPQPDVPPIGSYAEWSKLCRYPLLWLGTPDPATSLIEQTRHDPEQDLLGEFLRVWHRLFDDDDMMVREIVSKADASSDLMNALEDLPVMDGRFVNRGRLGWYLKKNEGRRAGGLRIVSGPNSQRRTWRVVAI